jgi:amylosucrase
VTVILARASAEARKLTAGTRLQRLWPVVEDRLTAVYDGHPGLEPALHRIRRAVVEAADSRTGRLAELDAGWEADPGLLSRSGQPLYSFYVDRFAGDLKGLRQRLDYLQGLGVRWLHPLPLLKPRPGDSDGGFAVADYRAVDPRLGSMDDLEALTADLQARGMGLFLDVVCNHTAREHPWAERARQGDPVYRDYYVVVDEAEARRRDGELIDVFPETAPGSFTHDPEMDGHVWTTFYPFQWDLNYANPAVFAEMLEVLLFLAGRGVQGFRLDSAPFLWKAPGTTCRNLPQAYLLVEAWRAALSIAAPSVMLLAEAIESPADVIPFFGDRSAGCDLAYSNGVMTALWAALADQDAGIFRKVLADTAVKPARAAWVNYVRCHDDIIWNALADHGSSEDLHRWSRFFGGQDDSYSGGQAFQAPAGAAASTNGMASALVGVTQASRPGTPALDRLKLLYSVIFALDGFPLIYMGDEIALGNDGTFLEDAERAGDGRWLHRPCMDWSAALDSAPDSAAADVLDHFRRLAESASGLYGRGVSGPARPLDVGAPQVLAYRRADGDRALLVLANLSGEARRLAPPAGFDGAEDLLNGGQVASDAIILPAYACLWLLGAG